MDDLLELLEEDLLGVPFGGYIVFTLVVVILFFLLKRVFVIGRLYFIAGLTSKGRITRVKSNVDGDTIKVIDRDDPNKKKGIRMIGVDTPESLKSLYMDIAPFGKEASDYTKKRIKPGMKVFLIYDVEPLDKFGRELVYVYLANGEFYNATLIKEGYAFAAEYKPNLRYAALFRKLENKAKRKGKRLWEVYDEKGVLSKKYKRSNAYRRFKYKHRGKDKK